VLDHNTGKVWFVFGPSERPVALLYCQDIGGAETDSGCHVNK
jgi:hypothetical protein